MEILYYVLHLTMYYANTSSLFVNYVGILILLHYLSYLVSLILFSIVILLLKYT